MIRAWSLSCEFARKYMFAIMSKSVLRDYWQTCCYRHRLWNSRSTFQGGGGICTSLEYWLDLLVTEFVRVNTTWSVHDLEEVRWLSSVTRGVMTIVQTVIFSYLAMTWRHRRKSIRERACCRSQDVVWVHLHQGCIVMLHDRSSDLCQN